MQDSRQQDFKERWDTTETAPLDGNSKERMRSRIFRTLNMDNSGYGFPPGPVVRKQTSFQWYGVAASVVLVLALLLSLTLYFSSTGFGTHSYATGTGEYKMITLPDSTVVWLNAESHLSIENDYNRDLRIVHLEGEAYFEVQSDRDRPFIVKSPVLVTRVLGTKFNVKSYRSDSLLSVTVTEGKVRVWQPGQLSDGQGSEVKGVSLNAGEQAVTGTGKELVKQYVKDPNSFTLWRRGVIEFNKTPLSRVASEFKRYFGREIQFADPMIQHIHITGRFDKETWKEIKEMICMSTDLSYEVTDSGNIRMNYSKVEREVDK